MTIIHVFVYDVGGVHICKRHSSNALVTDTAQIETKMKVDLKY